MQFRLLHPLLILSHTPTICDQNRLFGITGVLNTGSISYGPKGGKIYLVKRPLVANFYVILAPSPSLFKIFRVPSFGYTVPDSTHSTKG